MKTTNKIPSLLRYVSQKYVESFVAGEVLFRSLSHFRDLEEDGVRGDKFEGTRAHRPKDGLKANIVGTGETIELPTQHFLSSANEGYIYVSCMSTKLSRELAEKFNAKCCVEILNSEMFISRVAKSIEKFLGTGISKQMISKNVDYYRFFRHVCERLAFS